MGQRRTVFFVSDGTGITAQMLGHSLLTQFEGVEFNQVTLPFIDTAEKAEECVARIEAEAANGNGKPVVFSTLVNQEMRQVIRRADALFLDFDVSGDARVQVGAEEDAAEGGFGFVALGAVYDVADAGVVAADEARTDVTAYDDAGVQADAHDERGVAAGVPERVVLGQ